MVAAWFPGTDHGVFLHAGRSGGLIFDVDTPEKLAQPIRQAINQYAPPYQSTRPDKPGRGHYIFATPDGRQLGNSLGDLANGWGEIRALNGVIIAAPSAHGGGGEFRWLTTGPVPQLPGYVASRLPDALDATDAATDADVAAFLAEHAEPTQPRPDLLDIHALAFKKAVANGESRHATMPGHITGAMKEAAAGLLDAKLAAGTLEAVFLKAVAQQPTSTKQGKPRTGAPARNEWRGLLAWAVGQARAADPAETIQRVEEKFQGRSVENLHELGPADVPPINQGPPSGCAHVSRGHQAAPSPLAVGRQARPRHPRPIRRPGRHRQINCRLRPGRQDHQRRTTGRIPRAAEGGTCRRHRRLVGAHHCPAANRSRRRPAQSVPSRSAGGSHRSRP